MPAQPDQTVEVLVDGEPISTTNPLPTSIDGGDIELGAVEIKDGSSDQRATVNAQGEQLVKDGGGLGALVEAVPASDTASSAINGRLQRIAQRITSLIALLPASLGAKARAASLAVTLSTEDAALFPASVGSKAAAASFATTDSAEDLARIGIVTEAAPGTDTASSGLNGRLQRIAQRLTSLIALLPTALSLGGGLKTEEPSATTATLSNVNDQATNITVLAANANRRGCLITNDSAADLMLKFGATASATSFTVKILSNGYWEMPKPIYTGILDGIWTADSTGAARVTELT